MDTGGGKGGANMGAGKECIPGRGGVGRGTVVAGDNCEATDTVGGGAGGALGGQAVGAGFEKARLEDTVVAADDGGTAAAVLKGVATLPLERLLTLLL